MATLNITKTYENSTAFFESDLNQIANAIETLLNGTKLDANNFVAASITATLLNSNVTDNTTLENSSGALRIKDQGVTATKMRLEDRYANIGTITMFHTFNNTVSIPRGWMPCTGQVINETNYNAVHGAGTYASDNISTSALLNKYLPDLNSTAYAIGAASTTETGNSPMTQIGSNTIDLEHNHIWYNYSASGSQIYRDGIAETLNSSNTSGSGTGSEEGLAHALFSEVGSEVGADLYTNNKLSTATSIIPSSIQVIYIMKVI